MKKLEIIFSQAVCLLSVAEQNLNFIMIIKHRGILSSVRSIFLRYLMSSLVLITGIQIQTNIESGGTGIRYYLNF
jgi:hypothetical protein